jgi:hypothetical protein
MVDWQTSPGGLYIDPAAPDGAYLVHKAGIRFTEFLRLVDGDGTIVVIDTGAGEVSLTADTSSVPVVSVVAGIPGLVFDQDGFIVNREVSP